jgi:exodeoxyribonuclease V alpha subunit
MITVNDPPSGLFNGDVGVIERRPEGRGARFADPDRWVPVARLPARETAYALTIHKSQGSEYEQVAIVLPLQPSPVLTRELLYTGMTRSQGDITVIASESSVRRAVLQRIQRSTGLAARLAH